jgi:hypothetical protein
MTNRKPKKNCVRPTSHKFDSTQRTLIIVKEGIFLLCTPSNEEKKLPRVIFPQFKQHQVVMINFKLKFLLVYTAFDNSQEIIMSFCEDIQRK